MFLLNKLCMFQTSDGRTNFGASHWRFCQQGWWMSLCPGKQSRPRLVNVKASQFTYCDEWKKFENLKKSHNLRKENQHFRNPDLKNGIKLVNFHVVGRYGDHYEWNKVVTCIHNVLSQQRYLEHYGEVTIRNLKSNVCTCKITFVKVEQRNVLLHSAMFTSRVWFSPHV